MNTNFDEAVAMTLKFEGVSSNDPYDPGGKTKFGISQKAHPDVDVENLTLEDAIQIYKHEYWDGCSCDGLVEPLDFCVFDAAVQHGGTKARQWLRDCEGDWCDFNIRRLDYYVRICKQSEKLRKNFFWGWMNRLEKLNTFCFSTEECT